MDKTLNLSKFIFSNFKNAMKYFYLIIGLIILVMIGLHIRFADSSEVSISLNGFGATSIIFLFVIGLNTLKQILNLHKPTTYQEKNSF
jgi:hypothetical protein